MPTSDQELPEEIASRLGKIDYNKDLTQQTVAEQFVYGERPYYNVAKMHAALGSSVSTDTVRARMEEMHERDVLSRERINNGDIYWLDSEKSDWPIPPDVEVEPERTEPTLTEWRARSHVRAAALSIVLAIIGTAVTLIGAFQAGGYFMLPIATDNIIATGLSAGIFSYLGLFYAGLLWIFDTPDLNKIKLLNDSTED